MEAQGKVKDANEYSFMPGNTGALSKLWANKRLYVQTLVKRLWTQLKQKVSATCMFANYALTRSKHLRWAPVATSICICY